VAAGEGGEFSGVGAAVLFFFVVVAIFVTSGFLAKTFSIQHEECT
jgi:hypothetical protein